MTNIDLFSQSAKEIGPLAARMRPSCLEEVVGQTHLLGHGQPLRQAIEAGRIHSFVLWGPPGVGKTTLAQLVSTYGDSVFLQLSAVFSGVSEIRGAIEQAKEALGRARRTVLFVDEVHRFNKSQQDAFLPHVENGTICFIGATTENPSFEINSALLSRLRVYKLRPIAAADMVPLLERALHHWYPSYSATPSWLESVAELADGDARQSLNLLELAIDLMGGASAGGDLTDQFLSELAGTSAKLYDKRGDSFYDQISALHKAVRGSDPDASLYWLARMLEGGTDPLYIARRCVRMASEDIGIADPRALDLALNAVYVQERLGSPEGELAIAQAVVYLSCAAKSNALYRAYQAATSAAKDNGSLEVPPRLRNAKGNTCHSEAEAYRYAHDEPEAYAAGEAYFPDQMTPERYYFPTNRGLEGQISERLAYLRSLDYEATNKRDYGR